MSSEGFFVAKSSIISSHIVLSGEKYNHQVYYRNRIISTTESKQARAAQAASTGRSREERTRRTHQLGVDFSSGTCVCKIVEHTIEQRRGPSPRRRTVIEGNEAVSPPPTPPRRCDLTVITITTTTSRENVFFFFFFSPVRSYSSTDTSDTAINK